MFVKKLGLVLLSSSLLIACGGSDSEDVTPPVEPQPEVTPPVTATPDPTEYNHQVQGVLAFEGAIGGADICVDLNTNTLCDTDEPTSTTDNDGRYQIDWNSEVETPNYYLVANWIDTTRSNVSQTKMLSRSFKTNKLNLAKVDGKHSNRTDIFNDGNAKLVALSDHQGAINALTHIDFKRYEQMLAQDLSEIEIADLRLQLSWLIDGLYAPDSNIAYQVTPTLSSSEQFNTTYQTHMHVAALIGDQINATLAIEKVLTFSGPVITALADEKQVSMSEFLTSDPIEVRYIVSDSLIAQGYIETAFDEKIINDNDWQVLRDNLFNDGVNHDFSLNPPSSLSTFTLEYGEATKFIVGYVHEGGLIGKEHELTMSSREELCWDNQSNSWKDSDTSYPSNGETTNNTISFSTSGTSVQTKLKFAKYNTNSDTWLSIINAQPAAFKFNQVDWPEYVYRYYIKQDDDVMCKAANASTFVMPAASVDALTSDDIARTVWSVFYPHNVITNEDKREIKVSYTAGEYNTFIWEHDTSPNGSPLIRISELIDPTNGQSLSTFHEYLVQDGFLIEVDIYKSLNFDDFNDHLLISYDGETNGFSQHFLAHIKALLSPTQP